MFISVQEVRVVSNPSTHWTPAAPRYATLMTTTNVKRTRWPLGWHWATRHRPNVLQQRFLSARHHGETVPATEHCLQRYTIVCSINLRQHRPAGDKADDWVWKDWLHRRLHQPDRTELYV